VRHPIRQKNKCEQENAPELPIGRFLKSKFLGGNRVILVDYEVLGLASDGRHCLMIFCLGLHFFWSVSEVPTAETIVVRSPNVANNDSV